MKQSGGESSPHSSPIPFTIDSMKLYTFQVNDESYDIVWENDIPTLVPILTCEEFANMLGLNVEELWAM